MEEEKRGGYSSREGMREAGTWRGSGCGEDTLCKFHPIVCPPGQAVRGDNTGLKALLYPKTIQRLILMPYYAVDEHRAKHTQRLGDRVVLLKLAYGPSFKTQLFFVFKSSLGSRWRERKKD